MLDPRFALLGAFLSLLGNSAYAVQTARGVVRPNRVSWFLWGAIPLIAFMTQYSEGVGLVAVPTLAVGIGPLLVFVASFVNRDSYWRLTRFDICCGVLAVVAVVYWRVLDNPEVAIWVSIVADLISGAPTIRKAWREPTTERAFPYVLASLNGGITLLCVQKWTVMHFAFPLYLMVLAIMLTTIVTVRRARL
ncbi:hypothetical protein QWI29_05930 [Mycolicibacterium neoaurum]|uniref:hypothetical protein n=1 Tax=Mycolicibacterium neoaurum TaxID=1795 RepID=UPI0026741B6A|nr:hypothetical protein [Mycolicibacterium neoaurum]MDO3399565.1 hypothetical protein [Mycolicibacterium neoaurum]